jgi:hypothetical protein
MQLWVVEVKLQNLERISKVLQTSPDWEKVTTEN